MELYELEYVTSFLIIHWSQRKVITIHNLDIYDSILEFFCLEEN